MAGFDPLKYPSLPSNYVSIAHLKERWIKEKEREQQEEEKEKREKEEKEKYPVLQSRIANGGTHSRAPVGKNLYKSGNYSGRGWRSKEVKIAAPVVEEGVDGTRGKKEMGCFGDGKPRIERDVGKVLTIDVAEEESSKGKFKWNSENQEVNEVANVCVVDGNKADRAIARQNCGVVFGGSKTSWRKMGDGADSVEQSGQKHNAGKEKVSVDVTETINEKVGMGDAFRGDNEVASVCTVEVVEGNKVDREIAGQNCGVVGYRGKKNGGRKMSVRVGEVRDKAGSAEQSGQERNAGKAKVSVDVKERTNEKVRMSDAFHVYGDKEVVSVCTVEVVGENKVDTEITGQNCGVVFRGKKHSWRKMANKVGEVSNKAESVEQSRQERNAEKEKVLFDVKERTNEKVRMGGTLCSDSEKEVEEVAAVFTVEVLEENKVDKGITGQKCRVQYRGQKHSGRKMRDRVGEVSNKADGEEQSRQERHAEKEKVSVDVNERTNAKVIVSDAFHAYSDKEAEEMATVCTVEVVVENKLDGEITGQKHRVVFKGKKHSWRKMGGRVGFSGKKHSWRKIGDRVGEVSNKASSAELSGQELNAEKEKVSVDAKERTNEKVRVKSALCAYGDKEVEEVATVCTVKVVEENKVDREIAGQNCRVRYREKKHNGRKMANRVGEVSDNADSVEQSGQERNAEKEEVSVDVKEKTNEKARVRGAFRAYTGKSKDVLIRLEDGLKMMDESDLGDLSLADRRYGHGRSSVGMYGDKWRYENSRRHEPRKMLKERKNSSAWIKKGESSNGNAAEIETQVANYAGFPV